jgi:hypothetical protein
MTSFVYDGSPDSLEKALDAYSKGDSLLCPNCGSELLVIIDKESRAKHKMRPGIYCLVNPKHMYAILLLSDEHEEFNRRFNKHK